MLTVYNLGSFKIKSFSETINHVSLKEKISGKPGNYSPKDLYNGAQFKWAEWNIVSPGNKNFKAGLKIGIKVFNDANKGLILDIWISFWIKNSSYLSGYGILQLGKGIKINYNYD